MPNPKLSRRDLLKVAAVGAATFGLGIGGIYSQDKELMKKVRRYVHPTIDERIKDSAIELNLRQDSVPTAKNKKAILVQAETYRISDTLIMNHLLKSYGYQCQVVSPNNATEKEIFGKIEKLAEESQDNHQSIFYFSGHGYDLPDDESSMKVSGSEYDSQRITNMEIFDRMGYVKGKKAFLIDSCQSGVFTDFLKNIKNIESVMGFNIIDDYVAIAGCPSDSISMSSPNFIKDHHVGQLTVGLYKLLNYANGPVNLSTADIKIANKTHRENRKHIENTIREDSINLPLSFEMQRVYDTDFIL